MHKYTTITAPFAGVVTKRYANIGSMIQAGTASQSQAMPVVRLSQNNLLRLILPVPESAVSRVRVGETVDVKVPSLGQDLPGPGGARRRQSAAVDAHHGYGSGRAESRF